MDVHKMPGEIMNKMKQKDTFLNVRTPSIDAPRQSSQLYVFEQ